MSTTNVAQVEDMAKMMCLSVENEAAFGGLFNCVSDRGVTLNGIVKLCAEAAGVSDVEIINYDPGKKHPPISLSLSYHTHYAFSS